MRRQYLMWTFKKGRWLYRFGLTLSVLLLALFLVSLKWGMMCFSSWGIPVRQWGGECNGVGVANGAIAIFVTGPAPRSQCSFGENFGRRFWPWWLVTPSIFGEGPVLCLAIPLWIPFVLTVLPSIIMWRRNRHRSGRCIKCGYNLAGNTSGVCPECGTAYL